MDEQRKAQLDATTRSVKGLRSRYSHLIITRAELQTALDLEMSVDSVQKVLDTYASNVQEFIAFDKERKNGRV